MRWKCCLCYHVGDVCGVDDASGLVELHLRLELVVLALHVNDDRVQEVDLLGGGESEFWKMTTSYMIPLFAENKSQLKIIW